MENAENIGELFGSCRSGHADQRASSGLFAPRMSQQYRMEQRRRRSQYDRGTSAAEREGAYSPVGCPPTPHANGDRPRIAMPQPELPRVGRALPAPEDVKVNGADTPIRNGPTNGLARTPISAGTGNELVRMPPTPPRAGLRRNPLTLPNLSNVAAANEPIGPIRTEFRRDPFTPAQVNVGRHHDIWAPLNGNAGLRSAPPRTRTAAQMWYDEEDAKRGPITS